MATATFAAEAELDKLEAAQRDRGPSFGGSKQRVQLAYNVSVSVTIARKKKDKAPARKKQILQDVAGAASPGDLLAIMGPSGSGKTTLLNCLSQRNAYYTGSVTANGARAARAWTARNSGFVQQEDLFIPTLTPREHLNFAATMRMRGDDDAPIKADEARARVEELILDLGLTKCADTLIGGQGSSIRGISGGEKKRLSLATEILGQPPLIFLDEPTSGLDSFMAEVVVSKLRALAAVGRTVLCTIHQPSSDIYEQFTHLHLLAEGRTAYFGPREGAVEHFALLHHPCPPMHNPADHYIRLLSGFHEEGAAEVDKTVLQNILDKYPSTPAAAAARQRAQSLGAPAQVESKEEGAEGGSAAAEGGALMRYCASWRTQLWELYKRTLLMYKREPILTRVRLAQAVVVSVMVGLIFLQLGTAQSDVQGLIGVLFFAILNQSILGLIGVLQVFPLEMPIFLREHGSASYRVDTYFLGRTLAELPIQLIFPAVYGTILYWLVGLPAFADTFFMFLLYVILASNAAISLGYVISALAKDVSIALALGPLVLMPLIIFAGLLINVDSIPAYFLWLSVFSFVQYGFEGVCIIVFDKLPTLECPPTGFCPYPTGASVLDYLSFHMDNKWRNVGILCALILGFRLVAYLALEYRAKRSRSAGY
ncbi:ABC transmembrane transporter [Tribonema minus]|uniref:ABC transmembrane transporter n=1 Tax=Tribonema minus TaxID=303371 RepID=A0A836CAQ7_9STRA|nr:ABC transmembrane transporter [Tribonema minus]